MPDGADDKKELATNRLLKILRGDSVEDTVKSEVQKTAEMSQTVPPIQEFSVPAAEPMYSAPQPLRSRPSFSNIHSLTCGSL